MTTDTLSTSSVSALSQPRVVESPSHQEIAERAFELFVARGETAGSDLDDWLQAERELLLERSRQLGAVDLFEDDRLQVVR